MVSNPEFLREGSAVHDFLYPDRVVLGSTDREAAENVAQLYLSLQCPILITDLRTAEMIKYASNAFLATKISFINEISSICERLGADVKVVAQGHGAGQAHRPRLSGCRHRLGRELLPQGRQGPHLHGRGQRLPSAAPQGRERDQPGPAHVRAARSCATLLGSLEGKTVGVLGLSFKPNTDDMRDAPAVDVIKLLRREGAVVKAYDPVSMASAAKLLSNVEFCANAYEAARAPMPWSWSPSGTSSSSSTWRRIKSLMRQPVLVDGRNIYQPEEMRQLGFTYRGVGRGY